MNHVRISFPAIAFAGAIALGNTGCSTGPAVQSYSDGRVPFDSKQYMGTYQLARALLPVSLSYKALTDGDANKVYGVMVSAAKYSGDPSATYVMRYEGNAGTNDNITIGVDASTQILTSVSSTVEDRADEIVTKIIKAVTESGVIFDANDMGEVIWHMDVDPLDSYQIEATRRALVKQSGGRVSDFGVVPVGAVVDHEGASDGVDCSVGFCFRGLVPYRIFVEFKNGNRQEIEVQLPNGGRVIPVEVSRSAFVERKTVVTFAPNGVPSSIQIVKPSGGEAVAALPIEIAKAIMQIPAQVVELRVNRAKQEIEEAEQRKKLIDAERALADARGEPTENALVRQGGARVILFGASGPWKRQRVDVGGPPLPQRPTPVGGGIDFGRGEPEQTALQPGPGQPVILMPLQPMPETSRAGIQGAAPLAPRPLPQSAPLESAPAPLEPAAVVAPESSETETGSSAPDPSAPRAQPDPQSATDAAKLGFNEFSFES